MPLLQPSFRVTCLTLAGVVAASTAGLGLAAEPTADSFQGNRGGETRTFTELKIACCWCPAGTFTMGASEGDPEAWDDEKPPVQVTLTRGFWIGQTEVTQKAWKDVMATEPWKEQKETGQGEKYPALFVHWEQCLEFCEKLTARERAAGRLPADWLFRLPTEAEWEYACRAGTTTPYSFGADPKQAPDYAWGFFNTIKAGEAYAHEVGLKKPNPWNLHDMHGNAEEYCQDRYNFDRPPFAGGADPLVTSGSNHCVSRGGRWSLGEPSLRSSQRAHETSQASKLNGFRLVLSAPRPAKPASKPEPKQAEKP